jgi:hypothetical protein
MINTLRRAIIAVAMAYCAISQPASAGTCWTPVWQQISDPLMGVSLTAPGDSYVGYGRLGEFISYSRSVRDLGAEKVPGPCSGFSFSFTDFGGKTISDVAGLYAAEQARLLKFMPDTKLISSNAIVVGGLPARDIIYSFGIPELAMLGESSLSTRRTVLVARGDRLHSFDWHWNAGPPPADAKRALASIRWSTPVPDPKWRSRAMLSMAITEYWRYHPSKSRTHFSPALTAMLDPRRATDAAVVKEFGFFFADAMTFRRVENGYNVFRVKHEKAEVDWFVKDDGRYITAIRWQKI